MRRRACLVLGLAAVVALPATASAAVTLTDFKVEPASTQGGGHSAPNSALMGDVDFSREFVVDASGLFVLSACRNEHKDRIAIMRHKYFVFGGSYDWYWLYDPRTEKEIGPLGEIEDKDLAKQAEDWCG